MFWLLGALAGGTMCSENICGCESFILEQALFSGEVLGLQKVVQKIEGSRISQLLTVCSAIDVLSQCYLFVTFDELKMNAWLLTKSVTRIRIYWYH